MRTNFGIPAAAAQMFQIIFRCKNPSNSRSEHVMTLSITDTGLLLWDNSASQTVWTK